MATIIDSLLVTLGLDATNFNAGQKAAVANLRQTEEQAQRTAREMSSRGRQGAEFFDALKTSALSFLGVFAGAKGLEAILNNTTKSVADLGRQAANIGIDVSTLDAFGMAVERAGGNADEAKNSLQTLANAMETLKITGQGSPDFIAALNLLSVDVLNDTPFMVLQKAAKFAEENKNNVQYINKILGDAKLSPGAILEARRGPQQVDRDIAESRKIGVVTPEMSQTAADFQRALTGVYQALNNIVNIDVEKWQKALIPVLNAIKEFVIANPEIATRIFEVAAAFTALGVALSALGVLRVLAGVLGLRAMAGAVTGLSGAIAGLIPLLLRSLPLLLRFGGPIGAIASMFIGKSTASEEQERAQINEERLKRGEEPLPEPVETTPEGSRFVKWLESLIPESMKRGYNSSFGTPGNVAGSSTEIADTSMDPVQKAFLQTISGPESQGRYDVRQGGETFNDFSQHPTGIGKGGRTTAAGKYQFTDETWKEQAAKLGLRDFSPVSQDRAAWDLAETRYRRQTGRDLRTDFAAGNMTPINAALNPTWTSMPGGSESSVDAKDYSATATANLDRYRTNAQVASGSIPTMRVSPQPSALAGIPIPPGSVPVVTAGSRASTAAATAQAAAAPTPNNTTSTEMHIGTMNVHTQSKDPDGISRDIERAMSDRLVTQANRGLQ